VKRIPKGPTNGTIEGVELGVSEKAEREGEVFADKAFSNGA
jgi:hypothetical protein